MSSAIAIQCSVSQQTINNRLGLPVKGSEEFLILCLSVVTALVCLESLLLNVLNSFIERLFVGQARGSISFICVCLLLGKPFPLASTLRNFCDLSCNWRLDCEYSSSLPNEHKDIFWNEGANILCRYIEK